jgi:hypothetical protein
MGVPYHIIVEEQERDAYAQVIAPDKVLVLPRTYKDGYDTCDELGDTKSKGPGAARNYAWAHSMERGYAYHWVMDDNIRLFFRANHNLKVPVKDGAVLRAMEDFVQRYENVAMAGPNYFMFFARKTRLPPFVANTRIYSCNLIRNDIPFRWRGRYNEDTDLSLRILKAGLCTIIFNAFLQYKMPTQTIKGGNTEDFYAKEGTYNKSAMQVELHPDVSKMKFRFGRIHHHVDYKPFAKNALIKRKDIVIEPGVNNYGMELVNREAPAAPRE